LLQGKPHQQIIAAATRHGADLIAVGCHGDEGFARAWIGGVAQKVIGLADCPVLVRAAPLPVEATSP
jgi:nucleotide-binding universal stress UspA family protein